MTFVTKKFDIDFPVHDGMGCSVALIGASRSGKTTLLKHIYKQHFKKHITVMFSMNPHAEIYANMSSKVIVADKFHGELIAEAHKINSLCENKFPFLFISDDYVDNTIKNHQEITRALTIYRNANICSIFSFQGRVLMSHVGRNNCNYIMIFKQNTPMEWEAVIKEFLGMWLPTKMTMREMIEFCRKATESHQFFCIDQINGECFLTKLGRGQV